MKNPTDNQYTARLQITSAAGHSILKQILANYQGSVAIRLWDGKYAVGNADAPCTVVFNQPSVLRQLILRRNVVHLAADYLAQEVDIEGDAEHLFDLVSYMRDLVLPWTSKLHLMWLALKLPGHHREKSTRAIRAGHDERRNTKQSISHHYDVGNDFYSLWLDRKMVYSCAYFSSHDQLLDEAQNDKLDYICRKLRLTPGETLLDIGCGWGALVCWAAQHYGVKAHGITLSEQQAAYANERIRKEGLQDQVTVELLDYRNLPADARYDRVVSVGMFEHIGVANFPTYFNTIKRVLAPGGLFLNHGITNDTGWRDTPITRFINSYVFPDGELARIGDVVKAMERAGFEVIDVEGLRHHYALTLRCWVRALEANKARAVAIVGEPTYRAWRFYMSGSAYYFDVGSINVFQVLAGHDREPLTVGLRRDELYEKGCECQTASKNNILERSHQDMNKISIVDMKLHEKNLSLQAKYNITAYFYDILGYLWERKFRKFRSTLVGELRGKILEAGIGTGSNLEFYHEDVDLVGIELSKQMLRKAEKRIKNTKCKVRLIHEDATTMQSIESNQFDWIISTFMCCVMPDEIQNLAIEQFGRVLKQGGGFRILEIIHSKNTKIKRRQDFFSPLVEKIYGSRLDSNTLRHIEQSSNLKVTHTSFLKDDTYLLIEGIRV